MAGPENRGRPAARVLVGRGARATEEMLLGDLEAMAPSSATDLAALARPVVVVVPSRSLRLHLAARLVRRRGRAVAGVEVVTLHGLAAGILGRLGERPAPGAALLPVLVQRFARGERALAGSLDPLLDGYSALVGTVRDLVDAGFEPPHAEAVEQLITERGDGAEVERARAVVRTAAAVCGALDASGFGLGAHLLRRATDLLRSDPGRALPARAVLIHGFADATGVATDLVEALLRVRGAAIVVDQPPDPVEPSHPDAGVRFGERFLARVGGVSRPEYPDVPPSVPERLEVFRAPGPSAEVREVARRIRRLLAAGAEPERIGVVARDLALYSDPIQVHFRRLGVPFSGVGAVGSHDPGGRRVAALAELVRLGGSAPIDVWLSARGLPAAFDLRLGLRVCGAGRLAAVAALEVGEFLDAGGDLPLPLRRGLVEIEADGEEEDAARTVAPRRKVPGARLEEAAARARSLVGALERWPATARFERHLALLRKALTASLGWSDHTPGADRAGAALAGLAQEVPGELALSREEFVLLVRNALGDVGGIPLGGEGGGVQMLSVIEARARTFEHLFLLGLNRDLFPRPVSEDPLLPDRLRQAIERDLLPQIPIKRTGFEEERFLFAELLSSAPEVTLSWQACDDDGKARTPSPLVERLRLRPGGGEAPLAGGALTLESGEGPRPPLEHAVLAGLHGTREQFAGAFAAACDDAGGGSTQATRALAAARLAVLDELDPDRRTAEGRARSASLGPYFGFVGPVRAASDPRRGELPVTTLERLAACPWQAFLQRVLRLEPPPAPLSAVPGADPLLLGRAVHAVLQRVASDAAELPDNLEAALAAAPGEVAWPDPPEVEAILQGVCADLAREAGLALPGVGRVLAERARPYLEVARRLAWPDGGAAVLGVEVSGLVGIADAAGSERPLSFRADRVERSPDGPLLTDFKTGRPFVQGKTPETIRRNLLAAVVQGRTLQAVAYAAAAGGSARGRYLFLAPDAEEDRRVLEVRAGDAEFAAAFEEAARTGLQAWDLGSLFPRLEEPERGTEPRRCSSCEVRQACLRGDSGARRRLAAWAARRGDAGGGSAAERALLELWRLPAGRRGDASEGDG